MGYSGENAIPTNFQRVPPWPDGWYQLFPVIVAEMSYCPGKAREKSPMAKNNAFLIFLTRGKPPTRKLTKEAFWNIALIVISG